ncbi:MAG: hypothetical protein KatS3mg057_2656 [Herpetosiphonaceae bacterium]|nr:MAG: hypothetical protein KatS3mg057_2656 [Herpetosiphonaceae bacterium]
MIRTIRQKILFKGSTIFVFLLLLTLIPFAGTPVTHAATPIGNLDHADETVIAGWAKDADYNGPIMIHIYINGKLFDDALANNCRPDVGCHGFHYTHSSFGPGTYEIVVYAIGVDASGTPDGQNYAIAGSPKYVTVSSSPGHPIGNVDFVDKITIKGWAKDNDYSGPIRVHIYIDGVLVDAVLANNCDTDVGCHGFYYIHEPLGVDKHEIAVYAIGVDQNGQPNAQNPPLSNSPAMLLNQSCNDLISDAREWCNGNPNYWKQRQKDTTMLFNDYISIGINNSYGGMITQLYSNDRSKNLIQEHGGAAVQLSIWGYNDTVPNPPKCPHWYDSNIPWNPIQAIGAYCSWDTTSNDVDYKTSFNDGTGWKIRLDNPNNWTKNTGGFPGTSFTQTVILRDVYAQISYVMVFTDSTIPLTIHDQEIPAFFTAGGVDEVYYFANAEGKVVSRTITSSIQQLKLQGASNTTSVYNEDTAAEGWWSICNSAGTHCVTIATFSPLAEFVNIKKTSNGGAYTTPIGRFEVKPSTQRDVILYVFPYRYNKLINGKTIRQRIQELRYAQ